ncbi:MAG TPA: hypothetical protein VHL14_04050 [Steroidobacteraceae bacterium]|jgi:hypothetical protein|nr:hypothetical protein [Steroidobacteraceae bacterium]
MRNTIPRTALLFTILLLATALMTPAHAAEDDVRSWIDEQTTVSVTAQKSALTFFRRDMQASGKLVNFIDLGALEVNQAGKRRLYLCLLEWITDPVRRKKRVVDDFSTLTVWADDKELTFPRHTEDRSTLHISDMPYKRHTYNVLESYYEVSLEQLVTMSEAKTLSITAANHPADATPYRGVTKGHKDLTAFTTEAVRIAALANTPAAK